MINGYKEVVKILVEHGSDVDLQDEVLIFLFLLMVIGLLIVVERVLVV